MIRCQRRKYLSRRTRGVRFLAMAGLLVILYVYSLNTSTYDFTIIRSLMSEGTLRQKLESGRTMYELFDNSTNAETDSLIQAAAIKKMPLYVGRRLMEDANKSDASYPKDIFSLQQRRHGAVILHIFGMVYMFVALAVVCDEFFVPALGVITEKLDISEDVSGATFMAAGGSAPELFTSIIGVFISNNDVGIGTIVGSAVFNILFVIGMCAFFSSEVLTLTWWPLFRDVSFYSISLLLLIGFFCDDRIEWWEALLLFLSYFAYVTFMKYNNRLEMLLKARLSRCKCLGNRVYSGNELLSTRVGGHEHTHNTSYIHAGSGHYRHGVVQLMIHPIDPVNGAKVYDKALQLRATLQVTVNPLLVNGLKNITPKPPESDNNMQIKAISNGKVQGDENKEGDLESGSKVDVQAGATNTEATSLEETEEPLDISWPDTLRKRVTYILLAPIILPLYLTLPDVRRQNRRMFFPWTFIGSVLWIAGYSYCMVWWASQTGETIGIPDAVMGLTVLAAGTSIPDLITSVIVAKKGFGDMAVSSSVGSNLFDITVGLPVPWLMYSALNSGDAYLVVSKGMLCSIFLLFLMLVAVIGSIAASGWKMNKALGVAMLVLYLVFMTLAVLLEYELIVCPAT